MCLEHRAMTKLIALVMIFKSSFLIRYSMWKYSYKDIGLDSRLVLVNLILIECPILLALCQIKLS